ncbi:hypothetical protein BV898_16836 [Hypsibius exemplaris]|uniref:Receptor ligand binding region domain-containing protein n=1 Tax=Hypsibius exemplaris TaxID=2072580 RepID=A0A9X6NGT8_HYPEX|nr:hypothetical protein BV898_16836 [Hypsibius exemplaris]
MDSSLLFIAIACRILMTVSATKLQIVTSLNYNLSLSNDVIVVGAAFELAVEIVNRKYKGHLEVSIRHLFNASDRNCDQLASHGAELLSQYYYKESDPGKTCYAIVTTPCNDGVGTASLASGWDWLLFNNALAVNDEIDPKDRLVPAVSVGGTYRGFVRVILDFLVSFKWYRFSILVETATAAPFYKNMGNHVLRYARLSEHPFDVELYRFNSDSKSLLQALALAKERSRVMILFTLGSTAAAILAFINVHPSQGDNYGWTSQFSLPDVKPNSSHSNSWFVNAHRSFFFITYQTVTEKLKTLSAAIAAKTEEMYNFTYSPGIEPLDAFPIPVSYDIVEIFAELVNSSRQANGENDGAPVCSGLALANSIAQRRFSLTTGAMYVNAGRARNLNIDIFGFDTRSMTMQLFATYNWIRSQESHLQWTQNVSNLFDWPTKDGLPPSDVPLCGFSGTEGLCSEKGSSLRATIVIVVAVVTLTLLSGIAFLVWQQNHRTSLLDCCWWILSPSGLSKPLRTADFPYF